MEVWNFDLPRKHTRRILRFAGRTAPKLWGWMGFLILWAKPKGCAWLCTSHILCSFIRIALGRASLQINFPACWAWTIKCVILCGGQNSRQLPVTLILFRGFGSASVVDLRLACLSKWGRQKRRGSNWTVSLLIANLLLNSPFFTVALRSKLRY